MIRLIIRIPAGQSAETISPQAQAAIVSANGRWASPMPGTQEAAGFYIADAIAEGATPEMVEQLAPGWEVIGAWEYPGTEVRALNMAKLSPHLVGTPILDGFEVVGQNPPVEKVPHGWAGWDAVDN